MLGLFGFKAQSAGQFQKFDNIAHMHIYKRDNAVHVCDCVHVVDSLESFDVFCDTAFTDSFSFSPAPIHWYGLLPILPNP